MSKHQPKEFNWAENQPFSFELQCHEFCRAQKSCKTANLYIKHHFLSKRAQFQGYWIDLKITLWVLTKSECSPMLSKSIKEKNCHFDHMP